MWHNCPKQQDNSPYNCMQHGAADLQAILPKQQLQQNQPPQQPKTYTQQQKQAQNQEWRHDIPNCLKP